MHGDALVAFLICALAGGATAIGSLLAISVRQISGALLSVALGFSAGAMVFVSFAEILPKAHTSLASLNTVAEAADLFVFASFFLGMVVALLIDRLLPEFENPHTPHEPSEMHPPFRHPLMRVGVFTALALGLHNLPEGVATFVAALNEIEVGVAVAIAVAVHNIPEGIAVAVPVYCATRSRWKAFWWSALSGLAEPLGALAAWLLLAPYLAATPWLFGVVFAAVAGIMVFISFDELLPAAQRYGLHHHATYGMVLGMVVMAASLLLLRSA